MSTESSRATSRKRSRRSRTLVLAAVLLVVLIAGAVGIAAGLGTWRAATFDNPADADPDYTFDRWSSALELTDDDRGPTLVLRETLTFTVPAGVALAAFERLFPDRVDGARLRPEVLSVTDADGSAVPFEVRNQRERSSGGRSRPADRDQLVEIRPAVAFTGTNTLVITTTLHDVLSRDDDGVQFDWELLSHEPGGIFGPSRQRPVAAFDATIRIDAALLGTADPARSICRVRAVDVVSDACVTRTDGDGDDGIVVVTAGPLPAGASVSVAIPLDGRAATVPPQQEPNPILDVGGWVLIGLATLALVLARLRVTGRRRESSDPSAAPEPDALERWSPAELGVLAGAPTGVVATAQLIRLSSLGATRLGVFADDGPARHAGAGLRVVSVFEPLPVALGRGDLAVIRALGGNAPVVDTAIRSSPFRLAWGQAHAGARRSLRDAGLVAPDRVRIVLIAIAIVTAVTEMVFFVVGDQRPGSALQPVGIALVAILLADAVRAHVQRSVPPMLRGEAEPLRRRLAGSRAFFALSHDTQQRALTRGPDGGRLDDAQIARRAEELLPIAILVQRGEDWGRTVDALHRRAGTRVRWLDTDERTGAMDLGSLVAGVVRTLGDAVLRRRAR